MMKFGLTKRKKRITNLLMKLTKKILFYRRMKMNSRNEEWKDIEGYDGNYQISSAGRVRRMAKTITIFKSFDQKILSQTPIGSKGNTQFTLSKKGFYRAYNMRTMMKKYFPDQDKTDN